MMPKSVAINGKFFSAGPTGVHRVGAELIRHLDRHLASHPRGNGRSWEILLPRNAKMHSPLRAMMCRTAGHFTWQIWEQFELPVIARGKTLVSLCNLAPIASRGGITMIHDAQVFISPASYGARALRWYQFALPKIGASAAKILTVSEFSRRKLEEHGVAPRSKIEVIHNGVDHITRIEPDRRACPRFGLKPKQYVVAMSSVKPYKNIAVVLRAFRRAEVAGLKLVLVGPVGPESFAEAGLKLPQNVIFTGHISEGELRALLEDAACLVYPSLTEGFGLPPLEAMALGCPVVTAPCGAMPEICGDTPAYADPEDDHAWALEIQRMTEDEDIRSAALVSGKARAARFTWADSALRLLDVIERVANGGAGSSKPALARPGLQHPSP